MHPIGAVAPSTGTKVAFDLNDAGRAALGPSMGPEIARIQGSIVSQDAGDYLVAVDEISMMRGGTQTWRGEQVRVKPGFVNTTYERRFSMTRTVLLGAVTAGGIAYLVTRSVNGSGQPDQAKPDTLKSSIRGVWRP